MGQFVSMLTSHSSWGEWFPPGLGGLAYLTSHIFTMVASAPLWGQRSEFQTSWVITDFSDFSAYPPQHPRSSSPNQSHSLFFQLAYFSRSFPLLHLIGCSCALLRCTSFSILNLFLSHFFLLFFSHFRGDFTPTTQPRLLPLGSV